MPNPSPTLDKNFASMGPGILSSIGLGSGGRLLRHFQAPTLHWIHFSLRKIGSPKADPVQFKRGFEEGLLKDKIAFV